MSADQATQPNDQPIGNCPGSTDDSINVNLAPNQKLPQLIEAVLNSGPKMDDNYRERWLKANAEPDIIAHNFADVLRNLVRAMAARESSSAAWKAAEQMKLVSELLERCEPRPSFYAVFSAAIESIQSNLPNDPDNRRFVHAANDGKKYLVESSATDNAARGRASRRLTEFLSQMEFAIGRRRSGR